MFSVIFDMDGTLLDTQKVFIDAWEKVGRDQGIYGMGAHVPNVCGCNKAGWSQYLKDHFPSLDIDRFNKEMQAYAAEHQVVRLKPGARELIDFLKANNIKFALATGSSHGTIDHHLTEVGALEDFKVTVGGMDVQNGKPAPDIFLLAAEKLGVDPKDCFVIEDSSNGIRAGYAAGMKCIGIPDIAPFADEVKKLMVKEFSSMLDVISYFGEML